MFYVNSCCFCIDLKSGALILGWVGILTGVSGIYAVVESVRDAINTEIVDEFDVNTQKGWFSINKI